MNVFRSYNQKFRKRGFTDQLYWLNFKIVWTFVAVCVIITLVSGILNLPDLSLVSVGIPAAFTELGIHTAVIVSKSKAENLNKFKGDTYG